MTFFLDHLTATLVTGVLLVGLVVVQQRAQQSAIEATVRHQNHALTAGFLDTVQRDLENARPTAEAGWAFGGDDPSVDSTRFTIKRPAGSPYTTQLVFPTLAHPDSSAVVMVGYVAAPTGRTAVVDGAVRPTLRVRRYVYRRGSAGPVEGGGSADLVDFDVELFGPGGLREGHNAAPDGDLGYTPSQAHVAAVSVAAVPGLRAHDQRYGPTSSVTRHARTVYVAAAGAEGGRPATDRTLPQGVPAFPGD